MAIPEYKLSAVLFGHSLDVRCVAPSKECCILSASRDRTAKLWHPEGVKDFVNVVTYKGHNNFVACVCWLPPCESFPEGLVITGSNDNTILGYNLQDAMIQVTLESHENVVCWVTPGRDFGILLSSSWDNTAKVWNLNNPQGKPLTLKGHQAAVWCVAELCNGTYATASADKTIMLWKKDGARLSTLNGHTDCVRGLAVASPETFLSCSNDASIRMWTNKGECLNTYHGHTNYIYSISMNNALSAGSFVSSGEDGVVRVWADGDCVLQLGLPAQTVWTVACLENSDIVTGSSDGVVRVFTRDPARYADDETLRVYDQEVEKMVAASKQEIGGYKLTDLPGPEILLEPGKSDGQTKLVRRGTNVKCYSWSAAEQTWTEVGDVMGAPPPAEGKTMYQGQEYDCVFNVDIKDGAPPLKLPFNKTEDPWVAAQAFIHKNDLPQVYLEQVANFIITNAKLDTLPTMSNTGFADPFTGESRYVPGAAPPPAAPAAADPFTGASAYTTHSAQTNAAPLIPHNKYLRFDKTNLKVIHEKMKEFNNQVGDGLSPLTEDQLADIIKLGELNCTPTKETISLLKKTLEEWPKEMLLPVLDVTRLAVRHAEVNAQLFDKTSGHAFLRYLMGFLKPTNLALNQLVSLRVLVNAFSELPGEMAVLAHHQDIVRLLPGVSLGNHSQIAAMTLALNLSVALGQQPDTLDLAHCVLELLARVTDNEAYLRGLVALGTVLAGTPSKLQIRAKIVDNDKVLHRLKRDSTNANATDQTLKKIANCSQEILRLL